MAKSKQKLEAQKLRFKGESIKSIAKKVGVSTSTVSLWSRDIKLTKEQIMQLEKNSKDPFYGRRLAYSLKQQSARITKEKKIVNDSKRLIGDLTKRDLLIAGTALYWAEGFKKDKMVGFANTDPEMIKFFLNWVLNSLDVSFELIKLRVGINEHHKYREKEIQEYWSKITNIPLSNFYRPYYQKVSWKKEYEHPEQYFGTLRIRVLKSTDLLRKIRGLIEGIKISSPH